MITNNLVSMICEFIILALIITMIYIRIKKNPSKTDKANAEEFLNGLQSSVSNKILEIINTIDFSNYTSIEELESSILSQIYDTIWDYVSENLTELSNSDIVSAMVVKLITKEYVSKFVDKVVAELNLNEIIEKKWVGVINKRSEKILEEDNNLQSKFSDPEQYIEESTKDDLIPAQQSELSEEELSKLNPPKDEEDETFYADDDSMELIDEEDETYIDEKGRLRDKKTGRFV